MKKCKTYLCSLCIQYSGTNLFSLSNSKYDILNFYSREEALIVILVLFVKCKIIYFISKHKWRIATQIFANFTNCILLNYITRALTGLDLALPMRMLPPTESALCCFVLGVWQQLIRAGVDHNSVTPEPGAANGTFLTQHNNKTP